jgi:hypothetical protein
MYLYVFRALNAHLQEDTPAAYGTVTLYENSLKLCTDRISGTFYRVTVSYAAYTQCILLKMSI